VAVVGCTVSSTPVVGTPAACSAATDGPDVATMRSEMLAAAYALSK
jgi:hypothetical protein